MVSVAILATLHAKSDKVTELSDMLKGALELAQAEQQTVSWYAIQMTPSKMKLGAKPILMARLPQD
jgi:hypothetical protein